MFKSFRDGRKANVFVSHLEFALQRFQPEDLFLVTWHLVRAQKALVDLRQARAEDAISKVGWEYVASVGGDLHSKLETHGLTDLAGDAKYILDFARQQAATSIIL